MLRPNYYIVSLQNRDESKYFEVCPRTGESHLKILIAHLLYKKTKAKSKNKPIKLNLLGPYKVVELADRNIQPVSP